MKTPAITPRLWRPLSTALLALLVAMMCAAPAQARRTEADALAYIERFRMLALEHEIAYHIPACITLAQGLLESDAGKSELASKHKNHFGIKSFRWQGEKACYGDSTRQSCYRVYGCDEDSFLDHAKFLHSARYDTLYRLDITDYRAWAEGLRRCGYAEDRSYPQKLIAIIERYKLHEISTATAAATAQPATADVPPPPARQHAQNGTQQQTRDDAKRAKKEAERQQREADKQQRRQQREAARQQKRQQELAQQQQRQQQHDLAEKQKHDKQVAERQQHEQERQQRMQEREQELRLAQAERDEQREKRLQERRERAERYAQRQMQANSDKKHATRRRNTTPPPTTTNATSNTVGASADND